GREVLREMFQRLDEKANSQSKRGQETCNVSKLGPVVQTLRYFAAPRTITSFDIDELVRQAQRAGAVIVMACGVGDTLVENTLLLQVHGAKTALPESNLMRTIHFGFERTSEQDPKYPVRLLVDIAIQALSPAINDPTRLSTRSRICCVGWEGTIWTPAMPAMRMAICVSFSRCLHGRTILCWHSMRFDTTAPIRCR